MESTIFSLPAEYGAVELNLSCEGRLRSAEKNRHSPGRACCVGLSVKSQNMPFASRVRTPSVATFGLSGICAHTPICIEPPGTTLPAGPLNAGIGSLSSNEESDGPAKSSLQ